MSAAQWLRIAPKMALVPDTTAYHVCPAIRKRRSLGGCMALAQVVLQKSLLPHASDHTKAYVACL